MEGSCENKVLEVIVHLLEELSKKSTVGLIVDVVTLRG